ncbi:MAG: radical SAM protein, partial [Myxococcota bacterium]
MTDLARLLPKYDVPGPRYTSYPTVPCWDAPPTQADWVSHLGQALDRAQRHGFGAAIYVHIPFCRSLCTYCGCNTRITQKAVGAPYVDTLLAEWKILRERLARGPGGLPIAELHMGGGTPTFLTSAELAKLTDGLLGEGVMAEAELSLEADPRVTTKDQLATLRQRGFNRLSLGVQDFDPRVQLAIHRVQTVA